MDAIRPIEPDRDRRVADIPLVRAPHRPGARDEQPDRRRREAPRRTAPQAPQRPRPDGSPAADAPGGLDVRA